MIDPDFRLLGPLQVIIGGREIEIGAAKHRVVLACLLLRAGRTVPVADLVRNLWPHAVPSRAKGTVQTYISRLRRQLGAELLRTEPTGYRLAVPPESVDVHRFRALLAETPPRLSEALALWRGQALQGIPAAGLHEDLALRLEAERLRALEQRIELDLAAGRHAELVAELQVLTARHPLHEGFWRLLLLALGHGDRQGEALTAYQRVRALLRTELDAEPGPALRAAYQAVLTGEARPATRWRPVNQLPGDVAAFIGRTGLLAELDAALHPCATVLLSGPPGIGKTALAVHLAHRLRERFPDGRLHVNLRGYTTGALTDPAEIPARLLRALGLPPAELPEDLAGRTALLHEVTAGRRLLVLLDNLADPALLPDLGDCAVLITSRADLTLPRARTVPVGVLDPGEALELLTSLLGPEIGRAPEAAGELLDLCGRLPLALRIAAANAVDEPDLATQVSRLRAGNRLSALAIPGDPDAAVRGVFAQSHQRLSPAARRLFRLFGRIPGPDLDLPAATALCGQDAAPLLAELTGAGLLSREGDHYTSHDLLRLYAEELAAEDPDVPAALTALAEHYATTAATADPEWLAAQRAVLLATIHHTAQHGPHRACHRLARAVLPDLVAHGLSTELTAVCAAGCRAATEDGDPAAEISLALASTEHLLTLGDYDLAAEFLDRARPLAAVTGRQHAVEAAELLLDGVGEGWPQVLDRAWDLRRRCAEQGDQPSEVHAMTVLSIGLCAIGDVDRLHRLCEEALAMDLSPSDHVGFLISLAAAHWERGQSGPCVARLREAITIADTRGNWHDARSARMWLAQALADAGQDEEALALTQEVYAELTDAHDHRLRAIALNLFGLLHHRAGRYPEALACHQEALAEFGPATGDMAEQIRLRLSSTLRALGRAEEALEIIEAVRPALERMESRVLAARVVLECAEARAAVGDTTGAVELAEHAAAGFRQVGNPAGEEQALAFLAGLCTRR